MEVKRKVSIKNAVMEGIDVMGMDEIRSIPLLTKWAIQGDMKIGSYYGYEERINVLKIDHCKAELPCGTICALDLIFGNFADEDDCGLFFGRIRNGTQSRSATQLSRFGFLSVTDVGNISFTQSDIIWRVQDFAIVFDRDLDGEAITVLTLGYKLDEEGFPMINESHTEAVAQYLEYKVAKQNRWKQERRFSLSEIKEMQHEWFRLASEARGIDGSPSIAERKELVALLHDPLAGIPTIFPKDLFGYGDGDSY